jgi:hypothetical protein
LPSLDVLQGGRVSEMMMAKRLVCSEPTIAVQAQGKLGPSSFLKHGRSFGLGTAKILLLIPDAVIEVSPSVIGGKGKPISFANGNSLRTFHTLQY